MFFFFFLIIPRHSPQKEFSANFPFFAFIILGLPIGRGQTATWRGQKFVIPPCPPTIHSKVIRVSYYLQLDVKVPWGSDATIRLLIIMGTIPHQVSYTQQYQTPVNQTRQGTAFIFS